MNRQLGGLILLASILMALPVFAQESEVEAGVAISIDQDQDIWAGQQVTLNLDLRTTGFSFSNSHFNLPEVDGAFLMQTDTTTIKLTEKLDGLDWQVVRYPLALYPQRAGPFEIPPIRIRFSTSAGFGSETKAFDFQTEIVHLTAKLPPGAKPGDLIVTTASFELEHSWEPETAATKTGDAVTLTVHRRADDISAMLLPPLPVFRIEGLSAYPKTPDVNDRTNRGDLTGERTDSITWVVEKPGTYSIPAIRFQWWDPDRRELKQQLVPGMSLDILSSSTETTQAEPSGKIEINVTRPILILILTLIGLLALSRWFRFRRKTDDHQLNNEKSAFAQLQVACNNNQPAQAYSAFHVWITYATATVTKNSPPLSLNEFESMVKSDRLTTELQNLQEVLIGTDRSWQGDGLFKAAQAIRREIHHLKLDQSKALLAPLNP